MQKDKKIKAAIAAVIQYLDEEKRSAAPKRYWARFNRECIMQNRTLVQRRDFKKSWRIHAVR
jgi:hypothetical protein